MDKPNIESDFKFIGYQVNNINLTTNEQFQNSDDPINVNFRFTVSTGVKIEEQKVKVSLGAIVFPDANENNYPFSLEVIITGTFQSEKELMFEELEKFGEINGTAALFPFLRSTVANVCMNANYPPVMIPLINVYNFIKNQKENQSVQE